MNSVPKVHSMVTTCRGSEWHAIARSTTVVNYGQAGESLKSPVPQPNDDDDEITRIRSFNNACLPQCRIYQLLDSDAAQIISLTDTCPIPLSGESFWSPISVLIAFILELFRFLCYILLNSFAVSSELQQQQLKYVWTKSFLFFFHLIAAYVGVCVM